MKRILFTTILLYACGSDQQAIQSAVDAANEQKQAETGGVAYQPDNAKEVVVEYRKDGDQIALAISDTKELPACTHENANQLAWVKNTEQFFSCSDESWIEIKMKSGANGKDGVNGSDGSNGTDGPQGPKGESGEVGPKGEPGTPVSPNQWLDPIKGISWVIGAIQTEVQVSLSQPCSDGWRLPTREEARLAIQHGLLLASNQIEGPEMFWTTEYLVGSATGTCGKGCRIAVNDTPRDFMLILETPNAGIACLKE